MFFIEVGNDQRGQVKIVGEEYLCCRLRLLRYNWCDGFFDRTICMCYGPK